MIKQNLKLLMAIREAGMRQVDFARAVEEHFTTVSRVINGHENLAEPRKSRYARVLGKKVDELFDE